LFADLFATLLTGEFVMTTLPIGSVELETQKTDKVRVFPYPFLEFEVWKTSCASIPSSFLSVLSLWLPSSSFFLLASAKHAVNGAIRASKDHHSI